MKRVGNKSGQLVRSASRRRKAAARFQFDLTVDKVFGLKPGPNYLVKWTRGVKVAQTKPHLSSKDSSGKAGLVFNEKLSLLVTLYRDDNRKFDPKDSKISLVSISPKKQERTVAKIHFDLAQFAGVPHASSTKVFKLSDKVSIRATIESRFLKAATSGPGSAGASSALSGVSARSSDDDLDDDFGDLALDDIPESDSISKREIPPSASNQLPTNLSPNVPLIIETPQSASSFSTDRGKPPSNRVTSAETRPPHSGRLRPSPVSAPAVKLPVETGNGPQAILLKTQNEKLSADVARYRIERKDLEESHRQQLIELNSQLKQQAKEKESLEIERTRNAGLLAELKASNANLETKAKELDEALKSTARRRDEFASRCKNLAASEDKCKQLSQEVDRLVLAAERPTDASFDQSGSSEIEKRMIALREEKERLERKVKSHESHAAKTKSAYQKLTDMYNGMREQHVALLHETEELKANRSLPSSSPPAVGVNEHEDLSSQLEEARQEIRDVKSSKESLQSDYDRLLYQTDSVQDRLERVSEELEEARRESDVLHAEAEELKGQRDMAMHRALSKGKNNSGNGESTRSIGKVEEELRLTKDRLEREQLRLTKRTEELESEIRDMKEDVDYEKSEKAKAREERDKIRESARALERRTSLAGKQNDAMQSMRRQISTHQRKEQDRETTIENLQLEVRALRDELKEASSGASLNRSNSTDSIGEVLQDLVHTKLSLAQAEDDKLNLQFAMKTLKKTEKAMQEKLAAHASRLEVKLGQANEELASLRKGRGLEDATEFNDLGSDVDY